MSLGSSVCPRPSIGRRLLRITLAIPLMIALLLLIRMPLSQHDQTVFSGVTIGLCVLMGALSDSRLATSTLMITSLFCSLRYFIWRWDTSISYLNNSGWRVDLIGLVFAILLLCAETYSVAILVLGYFQSARPLKRRPVTLSKDPALWPSVDVFIPSYNEPLEVVRPTVLAAMSIDWPPEKLKIYILDDGRRQEFKDFAAECGAAYLTRSDNRHAKAGNINAALKETSGEYIAIFDCDHIATRSFLQLTMGWFAKDERLAMVQTPHHFYSPDPFERNLNVFRRVPNEGALFYGVVQDGNDLWNATFFCGSCAVIRREALEEIGGIAVETVTEDAHTALRLQSRGWNTAYIGIPQAAGLATGSLAAHVGQRIRWARGMVQILRTQCPLFVRGLKLPQRLCYFNCAAHYLYAIPRLIFVSAPLVYLLLGKSNLYGNLWEILAYAAPHLVLSNLVNSRSQGDHRHSFWNEVYEMVLAPYILLPTTFALINPKWGKFNVTAKSNVVEDSYFDWKIARPYLFLLALNLAAIISAACRYFSSGDHSSVLLANVFWAGLNSLLLGACVAACLESKQRRSNIRVDAPLAATLAFGQELVHQCRVIDISEGGVALRSDRVFTCDTGDIAEISIPLGAQQFRFPVQTVRLNQNRIHLRFLANDLNHQRAITQIIYARADAWLDWTKDQRRDRIISSLVNVLGIGFRGIWMLPALLVRREKKAAHQPLKPVAQKSALLGAVVLALLLPFRSTRAQSPTSVLATPAVVKQETPAAQNAQTFQETETFSELGRTSPLRLHNNRQRTTFHFIIPATKIVQNANLTIRYQAHGFSEPDSTRLVVLLNDSETGAFQIHETAGDANPLQVPLPADLLVHENQLAFELRSDCAPPCKPRASNLSVQIDAASQLDTTGTVLRLPNRLSLLPAPFFDPSVQRSIEVPFVFETQPGITTLKAAGILSAWYGAMATYRGSHFDLSIGQLPHGNAILLARSNGPLADALRLNGTEPQIAMCDNPNDHYGKVLALVAPSEDDLVHLAQFFTHTTTYPESDRFVIPAGRLTEQKFPLKSAAWSDGSKPLALAAGLDRDLLHAKIGTPTRLYFRVAPDLNYGTRSTVPLDLAFHLSGLTAGDHVGLGVRLNGTFISRRRLSIHNTGESTTTQSFALPVSLLYSSNTLALELTTDRSDTVLDPDDVDLLVLPATKLDLGNPAHVVRMPRLDLFAASGFPFTSKPDGSEMAVLMPAAPNAAQIGLYLDAMSFLSAQTGIAADRFDVIHSNQIGSQRDRNLLVVASGNDRSTFRAFESSMVVVPTGSGFEAGDTSLPLLEWLSSAWFTRNSARKRLSAILEGEPAPKFLLEQFANPFGGNHTVLILATRSEADTQPYFDRLSEASRHGLIHDGLALADDSRFVSFHLDPGSYLIGETASLATIFGWLQFHFWVLPVFIIAIAMFLAYRWENLLTRQAEKRLRGTV